MIRLYVPDALAEEAEIALSAAQAHYLKDVMRRKAGDEVLVFNGRDGEWRAALAEAGRRGVQLRTAARTRPQTLGPDLELVAALVKRSRLETIVEKATELGARRVRLVTTRFTNAERTNVARLIAIAVEAAEQTGRLDVPDITEPAPLDRVLAAWPAQRRLVFCDEAGEAAPIRDALADIGGAQYAILIGPEGGFAEEERATLRALPFVLPVGLGPRVLRADTAAIAALALWQAMLGDWRAP
ncbi:MAG TPA: 16S rRNA (uracil(1498)-N(3))-methyltransferase [Caulobacteraceae bacterium]|nr:16S rRNA (uracil(1498)-N(3))-methyltransferase [Caulobacteraceae bacterium]